MKTTKFRGKHITTGKWLYGSLVIQGKRCFIFPFEGEPKHKSEETEVVPKTVGQITGETDKQGKEVWEGDRVHAEGIDDVILTLLIGRDKRGFIQTEEDGYRYSDWFPVIEVIGNIHDNSGSTLTEMPDEEVKDLWRCKMCGSLSVQQRAWIDPNSIGVVHLECFDRDDFYCDNCEKNNYLIRESELLTKAVEWWGETDFRAMERITRYRQLDFSPEDGYQAFVDACNKWWNEKTTDDKISIYFENK
jgi:hypothetical protein